MAQIFLGFQEKQAAFLKPPVSKSRSQALSRATI